MYDGIDFEEKKERDLKFLYSKLLSYCVESEQCKALQTILGWIKKDIETNSTLCKLIEKWHRDDAKVCRTDGFTYNSNAMMRYVNI